MKSTQTRRIAKRTTYKHTHFRLQNKTPKNLATLNTKPAVAAAAVADSTDQHNQTIIDNNNNKFYFVIQIDHGSTTVCLHLFNRLKQTLSH